LPAVAQSDLGPEEECTVQILNRTVRVDPTGHWRLANIPVMGNRLRARLTCDDGVSIRRGEGPLMRLRDNGTYALAPIPFGPATPTPTDLIISGVDPAVTDAEVRQLTVTGVFPTGQSDVTDPDHGTDYFTTNAEVLAVSDGGLLTPLQSGNALITVVNQGITATVQVRVELGDDTDGDGLPDDWETANGLDPTDPTDALVDSDADDLTNIAEFRCGTDPFSNDTDGDSLTDGEEVSEVTAEACNTLSDPRLRDTDGDLVPDQLELLTGTSPTNAEDYDLDAALLELRVDPSVLSMSLSTLLGDSLFQAALTGIMLDGSGVDLTQHPDVVWLSASAQVADVTVNPGEILATGPGQTTIIAGVGIHDAEVAVTVTSFVPSALGHVAVTGSAHNVALNNNNVAFVATSVGLSVVTGSASSAPSLMAEIDLSGSYEDVKVNGTLALLVGEPGLAVVDITNPAAPALLAQHPLTGAVDLDLTGDGLVVVAAHDGLHVIDVSNPAAPHELGSVTAPASVRGVAIEGDIGIVALGTQGIAGLSLADPWSPTLTAAVDIAAEARDVDLADGLAVVAAGIQGMATVDMSDPTSPVHLTTDGQTDFMLNDVALDGDLVLGADYFRVNEVPIVNVGQPASPVFTGLVDFSSFSDDNGQGVDARAGVVALAAGGLYLGLYAVPTDDQGVAPTVVLASPDQAQIFIEDEPIPIVALATDDVAVARVEYFVDGELVGVRGQAPFVFNLAGMPLGTVVTLHAEAVDLGDNRGVSQSVVVAVVADPLTTVIGRVLKDDVPVEGAEVSLFWDKSQSTVTDALGQFALEGIPTVIDVRVIAEQSLSFTCDTGQCGEVFTACLDEQPCEAPYSGLGGPTGPVRGGTTDVGDIPLVGSSRSTVISGIQARPWTFAAFEGPEGSVVPTVISGIQARPWTFAAFEGPEGSVVPTVISGIQARPWTFESEDPP